MLDWRSIAEWKRILRYYQAGLVNAAFGYGLFAALIAGGLNMYLAQIIAHLIGMAFNYVTYSRYAFRGHTPSLPRFLGAYTGQYALSVTVLAACAALGATPYLAGFGSLVIVSVLNYFVLKKLVYRVVEAR
jgi:putative flippase GtrA